MPVKLVVFDLGGVMIRIRHHWSEVMAELGLPVPEGFDQDRLAEHRLLTAFQEGQLGESDFLVALAGEFGLTISQAEQAHGHILDREYEGALELVRDIQSSGISVFCLSNTNALHYREFFSGRFPVCEAFDSLLASHRLGMGKPDSRIYRHVEEVSGFMGGEIAFYDDAEKNVAAARAVGWHAETVDPADDPPRFIRQSLAALGLFGR